MSVLTLILAAAVVAQIPAAVARTPDETAVLAADARQRAAVAKVDLKAIGEIAHPNLRVNAPNNRILTREDLIHMVGSGEIRNEVFERFPEQVVVTGDVGVVMGREVVYPGAASEQARMYGQKTLNRRYTNIYVRTAAGWRHLARHANVIP
jgi:ethanolamine utilization microcompartment shell protein EutS